MFLRDFLEFNKIYKKNVGEKLNNDLKMKIWNLYQKKIAKEIIHKFYLKHTDQCSDCFRVNWIKNARNIYNKNPLNCIRNQYINFCYENSCNNLSTICCKKVSCINSCKFHIKCAHCKYKFSFIPVSTLNLSELKIKCFLCGKLNILQLTWKHKICNSTSYNTTEPNCNNFYWNNNKRYFYTDVLC